MIDRNKTERRGGDKVEVINKERGIKMKERTGVGRALELKASEREKNRAEYK